MWSGRCSHMARQAHCSSTIRTWRSSKGLIAQRHAGGELRQNRTGAPAFPMTRSTAVSNARRATTAHAQILMARMTGAVGRPPVSHVTTRHKFEPPAISTFNSGWAETAIPGFRISQNTAINTVNTHQSIAAGSTLGRRPCLGHNADPRAHQERERG